MNFILMLLTSTIFGGMLTFQFLFAPLVFIKLEARVARRFIRVFFPFYYLYFGLLSLLGAIVASYQGETISAIMLASCFVGFLISRQILMLKANTASDAGDSKRFDLYHRLTVLINTVQLVTVAVVLYICS